MWVAVYYLDWGQFVGANDQSLDYHIDLYSSLLLVRCSGFVYFYHQSLEQYEDKLLHCQINIVMSVINELSQGEHSKLGSQFD
jgi:hypothetical protein